MQKGILAGELDATRAALDLHELNAVLGAEQNVTGRLGERAQRFQTPWTRHAMAECWAPHWTIPLQKDTGCPRFDEQQHAYDAVGTFRGACKLDGVGAPGEIRFRVDTLHDLPFHLHITLTREELVEAIRVHDTEYGEPDASS